MRNKQGFTLIELWVTIVVIALLMSIIIPTLSKAKEQTKFVICQSNLRTYGIAGKLYTTENDGKFVDPWQSLYNSCQGRCNTVCANGDHLTFVGEATRLCRWHNPEYNLDEHLKYQGPLWPYLQLMDVNLCPKFKELSKSRGTEHPFHVPSIPILVQYGYSMNALLGPSFFEAVKKEAEVKRPSGVFYFAEENMWLTEGINYMTLNDNALLPRWDNNSQKPPFLDSFATFHKAKERDMNDGISNSVFIDGHAQIVDVEDSHRLAWPL